MADVHNAITRSCNMSRIGSSNNKPELLVRKFLFALCYRSNANAITDKDNDVS
jgi:G:T-mismatch repair DNA endonuclease (very short patch repair protein)